MAVIFTLPTVYIGLQRAAVIPETVNVSNLNPLPAGDIRSVEMMLTDDIQHIHSCELLCQRLLTGGDVQWIRMASAPDAKLPQRTIVYYRADPQDCAVLDHNFPVGAECLLAREDDGSPADLQMQVTELGDFYSAMAQNAGIVALTGHQALVITDLRDKRELIRQSRYGWTEPMVGFLEPDTDFDVAVRANGGFRLHRKRLFTGKIEMWKALSSIGIRMNMARDTQPFYSPEEKLWWHGPILTPLPYDEPLLTTSFAVARGETLPTDNAAAKFLMNVPGLIPANPVAGEAPAASSGNGDDQQIQLDPEPNPSAMPRDAQGGRPADDDLGGWLARISNSKGPYAHQALNIVTDMIKAAPPGTYDAYGDAYLDALETTPGLARFMGNFAFDPTPYLRDFWTAGVDPAADSLVLRAICGADARWSSQLVPFVLEAGQSLLPRYREPKFFGAELQDVVVILGHLNRSDLARSFVDQIDWTIVDGLSPIAKMGTFPEVTRDLLINRASYLTPCQD